MRAVLAALALVIGLLAAPAWAADTNLSAGKTATASSHTDVYPASNVTDGNQATYWESANNAFPQWVQVDLGSAATVNQLTLKLPSGWPSRTQTLTVLGSANGTSFSTLKDAATYTFIPTATIPVSASGMRYVRLQITANTAWPAGQLSEFEVYGQSDGGGDEDEPGDRQADHRIVAHPHLRGGERQRRQRPDVLGRRRLPGTLTVQLGANADLSSIVLKLNPDPAWGTRTQTIQVLGREQSATGLPAWWRGRLHLQPGHREHRDDPGDRRRRRRAAEVHRQLGAPGGQIAEFQVFGSPAPNPDLTVSGLTSSPALRSRPTRSRCRPP